MARADFPVSALARRIFDISAKAGCEARIVGGAVRDWLAGQPCGDIDMAVNAPIAEMVAAFRDDGLQVIETGIAHGTVTVLARSADASDKIEVTQTRVDLENDGRHAVVAFDDDWLADARRRDFTINAMYVDAAGTLYDPLDGAADLAAGRLRFVGDAGARVQEDALRMLRYCRFLPRFGSAGVDPQAQDALRANAGRAANLSGERVAGELRRIFQAPGAATAIALMHQSGVDIAALGHRLSELLLSQFPDGLLDSLPTTDDFRHDQIWLVGLAVALTEAGSPDDTKTGGEAKSVGEITAKLVADRLRLSNRDARCLMMLDRHGDAGNAQALNGAKWRQAAWYLHKADIAPAFVYVVARLRYGKTVMRKRCAEIAAWNPPECPVSGHDLLNRGVDKGVVIGQLLGQIERRWVESDFILSKEELLAGLSGECSG